MAGHAHVGDHQRRDALAGRERLDGVLDRELDELHAGARLDHVAAAAAQLARQQAAQLVVILGEQDDRTVIGNRSRWWYAAHATRGCTAGASYDSSFTPYAFSLR